MARGRDSGMPPEAEWETYFDPCGIVTALDCGVSGDVIEFGCGYGSFTIAVARYLAGTVYALDIDPLMVETTASRVTRANLNNVVVEQRDFVEDGCGRPDASAGCAMLFNILHIEDPVSLLREATRVLRVGGVAAVVHWKYDARTPRGPPLEIRPRLEQCRIWGEQAGLRWLASPDLAGSPWHWGLLLQRCSSNLNS
jgi:SAM-dependent methyltransferase